MVSVYVLESERTGRLYVGQTANLPRRLHEHRTGQVRSTKGRGPWMLLALTACETRSKAVRLERHLKRLKKPSAIREEVASW